MHASGWLWTHAPSIWILPSLWEKQGEVSKDWSKSYARDSSETVSKQGLIPNCLFKFLSFVVQTCVPRLLDCGHVLSGGLFLCAGSRTGDSTQTSNKRATVQLGSFQNNHVSNFLSSWASVASVADNKSNMLKAPQEKS